jgi:hypothetical protein
MTEVTYYVALPFIVADGCGWRADRMLLSQRGCNARRSVAAQGRAVTESSVALPPDVAEQHMLDTQNQGPQCTACGSPMKLATLIKINVPRDWVVEERRHWHAGNRPHLRYARFRFCSFGTQISASRMHCRNADVASAEQCTSADYTWRKSVRHLRQNAGPSLAGQTSFPPPSAMADGKRIRQWSSTRWGS